MKISEMFVSLQGEGVHQGLPAFFLRLTGCNLSCAWCDTRYSLDKNVGTEMSYESVFEAVMESGVSYVCITGGEPLLQTKELLKLLPKLFENRFLVDIETNGTLQFHELQEFANIEMDAKTPSSGEKSDLSLIKSLRKKDTLKFVVGDDADYEYMLRVLLENPDCEANICVTPVFGTDSKWLAERVIKDRLAVRLQLQLHKQLGIA